MQPNAQEILDSPVWKDAIARLEAELYAVFLRTPPSQVDVLTDIAYKQWALSEAVKQIQRELFTESPNLKR